MQIAQVLASYSLGAADLLRRAMGKKKPEEMAKQREIFLEGALKNAVDENTANYIFDLMEKFAGYGFNKSHSAAYALVSYQTAWLKAHYPSEFMAAVLSSDMDNTDKVVTLIEECRAMKLQVLPPDVNRSDYHFRASDKGEVIYGLGAIKGVGQSAIDAILAEREQGAYRSLDDFCERVDMSKANKKVMDALVTSGALDCFSDNRAALQAHLPYALQAAEQAQKNEDAGMVDLFASDTADAEVKPLPQVPPWDERTRLMNEKESLGLFLTGHPIELYEKEIRQIVNLNLGQWHEKLDNPDASSNSGYRRKEEEATVVGLVIAIRTRNGFNGREAFVTLDDRTGRIDVRVFPDMLQQIEPLLQKDQVWVVEGGISYDDFNNGIRIRAKKIELLEQYRQHHARALHLNLHNGKGGLIGQLGSALQPYRSADAVPLVIHRRQQDYEFRLQGGDWTIAPSDACMLALEQQLGKSGFYVEYH